MTCLTAAAGRRGTLWQSLQRAGLNLPSWRPALNWSPLIAAAPAARPFEFFSGVLQEPAAALPGRLGSEANDAIDALLDLALDYEQANGTSLAGFVNWFAGGEVEIKRNMEKGKGEVRIMTVHGAKGLEAPIVILPDTTTSADAKPATLIFLDTGNANARVPLWLAPKTFVSERIRALKDSEKQDQTAEYRRLLYVAMTRAQDELYVCGYTGTRRSGRSIAGTIPSALRWKDPAGGNRSMHLRASASARRQALARHTVLPKQHATAAARLDQQAD